MSFEQWSCHYRMSAAAASSNFLSYKQLGSAADNGMLRARLASSYESVYVATKALTLMHRLEDSLHAKRG